VNLSTMAMLPRSLLFLYHQPIQQAFLMRHTHSELSQNHRVLHTHIFKEVIPPPGSGKPSRLMITEVDRYGVERNRQAEFFFIELLVMSAPVMVDASTVGNKPPDLPITGVVFTTFPKYMMEILPGTHPGKITSNRLTMLKT